MILLPPPAAGSAAGCSLLPHACHRRAALEARIRRRYQTVTDCVRLGGVELQLTRVADPDAVLQHVESLAAAGDPETPAWQPYWAAAWESAVALAEWLAAASLEGQQILDMGCGLGLTGAVAAARGARVTMIDAAPPALLFARLNSWPWRKRVHVRRLDWQRERLASCRFDWILGADIVYDRSDWLYLEGFWREHLAEGGTLLLGEPSRTSAVPFPEWLAARGWRIRSAAHVVAGARSPVRIHAATRMATPWQQAENGVRC